jgi:chromosome segregation ATPase
VTSLEASRSNTVVATGPGVLSFGYTRNVRPSLRRILPFLICLSAGAGSLTGCHKRSSDPAASPEALKQSLDGLRSQFAELKKRYMDLRGRVDAIPMDLPGFQDARARFYAAEEGRGVSEARVTVLQSQLDAALSSGNTDELEQISKEIPAAQDSIRKIDEMHTRLLHQMMSFERMEEQRKRDLAQAAAEAAAAPPPATKPKRSKSKQ